MFIYRVYIYIYAYTYQHYVIGKWIIRSWNWYVLTQPLIIQWVFSDNHRWTRSATTIKHHSGLLTEQLSRYPEETICACLPAAGGEQTARLGPSVGGAALWARPWLRAKPSGHDELMSLRHVSAVEMGGHTNHNPWKASAFWGFSVDAVSPWTALRAAVPIQRNTWRNLGGTLRLIARLCWDESHLS